MSESTTVTVGLDVHARSIRLAAVRADELLEERTLPYDEEAVERALRRWPKVHCCYEAGPTGFGLYRHLSERGIDCSVVAPGLVPQRPGERVKTDPRDARKLARLLAGGLLEPIHVPSRELEAARDLVRAREDARLDRMRDRHRLSKFCLRHGRLLPGSSWSVTRRIWLSRSGSSTLPSSSPSTPTCTRSTWSTRASFRSSGRSPRPPSRVRGASSSPSFAACAASTP
jgi:transposase